VTSTEKAKSVKKKRKREVKDEVLRDFRPRTNGVDERGGIPAGEGKGVGNLGGRLEG